MAAWARWPSPYYRSRTYPHLMLRRRVLTAAIAMLCLAAFVGPAHSAQRSGSTRPFSRPIVVSGPRPAVKAFVRVTVEGQPYYFIVDTGAARTIIDSSIASRLRLRNDGSRQVFSTFGCDIVGQPVALPRWRLGNVALPASTVFSQRLLLPGSVSGLPVGGLFGADLLSHFGAVSVDFTHRRLTLAAKRPIGGRAVSLTVLRSAGAVGAVTGVRFDGRRARFLVDTGAPISFIDSAAPGASRLRAVGPSTSLAGAACNGAATPVLVHKWGLPGLSLRNGVIGRAPHLLPAGFLHAGISGVLGTATLARFGDLTIDYAHSRMILGGTPG